MRSEPPRRAGQANTDETLLIPVRRGSAAVMRRPRRSWWARLRLALLLVLGLTLLGAGLLYWQVRNLATAITVDDVRAGPQLASPLVGANLLIIGVDERPGELQEGVRGDTLILVRLDALGRWASLLSIPRDSEVAIPQTGLAQSKLNAAYGQGYAAATTLYGSEATAQQGGMALAAETVEALLRLPERGMRVDHTATVNFAGFAGLIDALGGIMIDVPSYLLDEAYPTEDFGTMRVEFQPGPQRMDGATALIYVRTRHPDSDFGRAERQQQVVRAMLQAFRAKGALGQAFALPGLLRAVGDDSDGTRPVVTTLPLDRLDVLFGLLSLAGGLDPADLGQFRLGAEQIAYTNGSNLVYDPAAVQALLDQWQRPPSEASERALIQVLNGTEVAGLAREVSLNLEGAGFSLLPPGNATLVERTQVHHLGGAPATARRLARTLDAELVSAPPPAGAAAEANIVVVLGPDAVGR